MAQTLRALDARGLKPAVSEHVEDLGVLLVVFLEGDELPLLVVGFVLVSLGERERERDA